MDYLKLQADAKDENRNLLVVFGVVIVIVAATAAAVVTALAWLTIVLLEVVVLADSAPSQSEVADVALLTSRTPWGLLYFVVCVMVAAVIVWVSRSRERALVSFGGAGIARSIGGRRIDRNSADTAERRFVNAVEEMAIAARRPSPTVFVLDGEPGINAFNAGWTDETTAIGVTSGALTELSREELQAVAAQAMSHVFHGDARLNLRLMALVTGVAGIAMIGENWVDSAKPDERDEENGPFIPLLVAGYLLRGVGWVGAWLSSMVQKSVARRHELLADATAVELLRQSEPMSDALRRVGGNPAKSRIRRRRARSINHLFMADAGGRRRGGLHPDLRLRVLRLDPSWTGEWLRPDTSDHVLPDGSTPIVRSAIPTPSPALFGASLVPGLEPIAPVFEAFSAAIPGLSTEQFGSTSSAGVLLDDQFSTGAGAGLLAPMMGAAVMVATLDSSAKPAMDVDRARALVSAVVHLATGSTPTDSSVPKPCSAERVLVQLDALRRIGPVDRPSLLAKVGHDLRASDDCSGFANAVVTDLRAADDLDQWMLRRLVLGNLISPTPPKKRRPLERLRGEYARVLSFMTAIGGGDSSIAFAVGVAKADLIGTSPRPSGELRAIDKSLRKLATLHPDDHARALAGLEAAMEADGASRRLELEFVEVVRLALTHD